MPYPLDVPLSDLRARRSQKWTSYPDDVLPLFVAETDVRLAPAIERRLAAAVGAGDTGYSHGADALSGVFADYYSRFGRPVEADTVTPVADVGVGIREALGRLLPRGSDVVYTPPVYMPFAPWIRTSGHRAVSVPLLGHDGPGPELDLAGVEAAFADGARAILLCHPHNPTGHLFSQAELTELTEIAKRHGTLVVSDEIWAPLTMPGVDFHTFTSVSDTAAEVGLVISSASKAFNLAGLKCAFVISPDPDRERLPRSLSGGIGHFGALAAESALTEGLGWLDDLRGALAANLDLLDELLPAHLPEARWRRPDATFVSWLDLRGYPGLGDDPAAAFLDRGRVALSPGRAFGTEGRGFARLNFACSPEVLTEAVERMGRVAAESS